MRRPLVGMFALALVAAACAIPTEAPNWDVIWNLPIPDSGKTVIPVSSFLPNGVTVIGAAPLQVFQVAVASLPAISRSLGAQCPTCPNGTFPKPAFTAPIATTTMTFTAGAALNTATLAAGSTIAVAMNNGFTFDPLHPAGAATNGSITLTVSNGGANLGTRTLPDVTTPAIPAGQLTNLNIPLSGTVNTALPITVTMTMDSPAGSAVAMNSTQTFTATSTPTIRVSQATVTIAAQALQATSSHLALSDGPLAELEKRIADSTTTQGSMFLIIANPMAIGANGTLTFTGKKNIGTDDVPNLQDITPISKAIAVAGGSSSAPIKVDFTGKELRALLGSDVTLAITGTTTAGSTSVTPTSNIPILLRMELRAFMREFKQ